MKADDVCKVKNCRRPRVMSYYQFHWCCEYHWKRHCDEDDSFNLKKEFGIKEEKEVGVNDMQNVFI